MYQNIILAAGQAQEFQETADFFRVMASQQTDLSIIFYSQGREVSRASGVGPGYAERFKGGGFDRVRIESATGGAMSFVIRLGNEVRYDTPPTGNVEITNQSPVRGAATQAQATVTQASALLVAAYPFRRYLLIQNSHSSGAIWLNLAGNAADTASGVKIEAGGSLELNSNILTGAVYAIGDAVSNPNVVVVEA